MENNLCYKKGFFGPYSDHKWAYKGVRVERQCLNCGAEEIYFGRLGSGYEDWRKKLLDQDKI